MAVLSGASPKLHAINVGDDAHQLKSGLQHAIEKELSDLFHAYNFRIVKAVAEQNFYKDCYTFIVGVSSPMVNGGSALCVSYDVTRQAIYDSRLMHTAPLASMPVFYNAFQIIARNLRKEIENCTREMPMRAMSNPYTSMSYMPNQIGDAMWNEINIDPMQQVQSFTTPRPKKKSKFEFIDRLIEESRQRLVGHAQPQFAFKYF